MKTIKDKSFNRSFSIGRSLIYRISVRQKLSTKVEVQNIIYLKRSLWRGCMIDDRVLERLGLNAGTQKYDFT